MLLLDTVNGVLTKLVRLKNIKNITAFVLSPCFAKLFGSIECLTQFWLSLYTPCYYSRELPLNHISVIISMLEHDLLFSLLERFYKLTTLPGRYQISFLLNHFAWYGKKKSVEIAFSQFMVKTNLRHDSYLKYIFI